MPEVTFDIKVGDAQWTRTVDTYSVKSAHMLCAYAERLFEIVGIPATFKAQATEAQE